jgi:hypothetical protein
MLIALSSFSVLSMKASASTTVGLGAGAACAAAIEAKGSRLASASRQAAEH